VSTVREFISYLVNPTSRINNTDRSSDLSISGEPEMELAMPGRRIRARTLVFNLPLVIGSILVVGLFVIILFGSVWAPQDPYITAQAILPHFDTEINKMITPPFSPSETYLLGTDQWGNDLLSLLLHGARVTLIVAFYITLLRFGIGLILGGLAGWKADRFADKLVMVLIGAVTAVPLLLSGMVFILVLGVENGPIVFIIALAAVGWTEIAQYVRGELLVIRRMPYIEAAEASGLSELQIVVRHALPNILPQLLVVAALEMGAVLLLLAELAFIGIFVGGGSLFTVDPIFGSGPIQLMEIPEWGVLVAQGVSSIRSNPHLVIAPALAFFVSILGLNLFGEGLRQLLDQAAVNTGFLLSKKMALSLATILAVSIFIINRTGPKQSFDQAASSFNGQRAYDDVAMLYQLTQEVGTNGEPPTEAQYIADTFREFEVQRGWKTSIHSSYFSEESDSPIVMGFIPGYDMERAEELVVLVSRYGASSEKTANERLSAVSGILELARLIEENQLDPRRSILFLAWGKDPLNEAKLAEFLHESENYRRLPIPSRATVSPAAVIQFDFFGSGGEDIWVDDRSDEKLLDLLSDSASVMGVNLIRDDTSEGNPDRSPLGEFPWLYFQWADPPEPAEDDLNNIDPQQLEQAGEILSRLVIEIIRQPEY
jgi:ABC-type dipeptide/oligopeptide/nickel transport system permease subunit